MAKILWNKQGDPLMAYGKTYFATTTGAPEEVKPVKPVEELDSTEIFNQYTVSPIAVSQRDFYATKPRLSINKSLG